MYNPFVAIIDPNATNFTNNPFSEVFSVFSDAFGAADLFFTAFFFILGGIIYSHSRSGILLGGYMVIIGAFATSLFSSGTQLIFGFITAIGIGIVFFTIYQKRRGY